MILCIIQNCIDAFKTENFMALFHLRLVRSKLLLLLNLVSCAPFICVLAHPIFMMGFEASQQFYVVLCFRLNLFTSFCHEDIIKWVAALFFNKG